MTSLPRSVEGRALLAFCSDAELLTLLCKPRALKQLGAICRLRRIAPDGGAKYYAIANGYKLVVGTALYNLLDSVVDFPDILGIKQADENLRVWWSFTQSRGAPALHNAITNRESDQAGLARRIDKIMASIRVANSRDEMRTALRDAGRLGEIFSRSAHSCSVSIFTGDYEHTSIGDILQSRAIERLLDYLQYGRTLQSAYGYIWRGSDQDDQPERGSVRDIETHIDYFPLFVSMGRPMAKWKSGIAAAMLIALKQLGAIQNMNDLHYLFERVMDSSVTLRGLIHSLLGKEFPSLMFEVTPPLNLSSRKWNMLKASTNEPTAKEELETLVGNEFRVIAANGPTDAMDFGMLIAGVVSVLGDGDRMQVIRVQHMAGTDSITWFSVAVRVPRFTFMSNWSKWWIFFKVYGDGMPEPDLTIPKEHVSTTLEKFRDRIELREFSNIGLGDFLNICEPGAWRHLLKRGRKLEQENSNVRGLLPELLAAIQLESEGYQEIRVGARFSNLGSGELDVIGIRETAKGGRVMIVEVKGRADSVNALDREIGRLASKLDYLNEHSRQLADAMGYQREILDVSGRFISMAELDRREVATDRLEIWDYKRFVSELKGAHLPGRIVDLLQPRVMAVELNFEALGEQMRAAATAGSPPERISLRSLLGIEESEPL